MSLNGDDLDYDDNDNDQYTDIIDHTRVHTHKKEYVYLIILMILAQQSTMDTNTQLIDHI